MDKTLQRVDENRKRKMQQKYQPLRVENLMLRSFEAIPTVYVCLVSQNRIDPCKREGHYVYEGRQRLASNYVAVECPGACTSVVGPVMIT